MKVNPDPTLRFAGLLMMLLGAIQIGFGLYLLLH